MAAVVTLVTKLDAAEWTLKLFLIVVSVHKVLPSIALVPQAFEADGAGVRKAATMDTDFMALQALRISKRLATVRAMAKGARGRAGGPTWRNTAAPEVLQDRTNIPPLLYQ